MKNIFNKKIVLGMLSFVIFAICFCTFSTDSTKVRAEEVTVTEEKVADFLTVKGQVKTKGTDEAQTADLRLVSTVDQLAPYQKVGFEIYFLAGRDESVANYHYTYEKTGVKRSIDATENGVRYEYIPQIFDEKSNYFITVTITGIKHEEFDANIMVQPFVTVSGGTRIYGASRYFTINEGLEKKVVNLSVKETDLEGFNKQSLQVKIGEKSYSATSFCDKDYYQNTSLVTEKELNTWTPYRHFKIQVDDTSSLSSVTNFVITDGTHSKTVSHRNLYSQMTGSGDTTWYDQTKDNYVLVTAADLYGFQSLVAAGETFENQKVHIGTNIAINSENLWLGIGSDFAGTIEGHGKAISGLHCENGGYIGLLSEKETVNNLKLTDCSIGGTTDVTGLADSGIILSNVFLSDGSKLDTVESKIQVTQKDDDVLPLTAEETDIKDFTLLPISNGAGVREVGYKEGNLLVVLKHCICTKASEDGVKTQCIGTCTGKWQTWYPTNSLPTAAGYWYMSQNNLASGQGSIPGNKEVHFDLNGKTIQPKANPASSVGNYYRGFSLNSTAVLDITDSKGNGVVKSGVKGDNGQLLHITNSGARVNLYAGTLDGTTATSGAKSDGRAVNVSAGTFNMYGGTIKCTRTSGITNNGNINIAGTFNMSGGTIEGGTATSGGAVYLASSGTLTMSGGTIDGGIATGGHGGNVLVAGTFNMHGGTISNGNNISNANYRGGNVYVNGTGSATMTGGSVFGGSAGVSASGNVGIGNSFSMSGGTIDGHVYVWSSSVSLSGTACIDSNESSGIGLVLDVLNNNQTYKYRPIKIAGSFSGSAKVSINATTEMGRISFAYASSTIGDVLSYVEVDTASQGSYLITEQDASATEKYLSVTAKSN